MVNAADRLALAAEQKDWHKTMSGIFISVVVPTYNRAQLVLAALDSVLSQTYANLEILVVDDGSTDETGTVIQRLVERKAGPRVRYFYQANQGQSVARNKGIAEAVGNWIAFLIRMTFGFRKNCSCKPRLSRSFRTAAEPALPMRVWSIVAP